MAKDKVGGKKTYNLLAEASSFVAWTAALLLRESAADFSIVGSAIPRETESDAVTSANTK